jgi:hypothetical protein
LRAIDAALVGTVEEVEGEIFSHGTVFFSLFGADFIFFFFHRIVLLFVDAWEK